MGENSMDYGSTIGRQRLHQFTGTKDQQNFLSLNKTIMMKLGHGNFKLVKDTD